MVAWLCSQHVLPPSLPPTQAPASGQDDPTTAKRQLACEWCLLSPSVDHGRPWPRTCDVSGEEGVGDVAVGGGQDGDGRQPALQHARWQLHIKGGQQQSQQSIAQAGKAARL